MSNRISDILLSRLSEFVAAQMGLHFPRDRWRDLERGIASAAGEFGFEDAESCIGSLVSSPLTKNQVETLASHLTVGETYFFREKKTFEILEEHILPELIRSRRGTDQRLRIWSAGCCTGEEPYSIAILLRKMIPDLRDWNIVILATDINPRFLQKASLGVYSEWSFRDTPMWVKEKYFKKTKESRFEILPQLKKMVAFSYLNLAEDAYPSLLNNTNAMDVMLCRNVLMYFAPEQTKKIVHNFCLSLVESGWLIVSPSETSHILFSQFVTVNFPGAILYKKDSNKPQAVEVFPHRLAEEPSVLFWPPLDIAAKSEQEVRFLEESREPPPDQPAQHRSGGRAGFLLETGERKPVESKPSLYMEALALYDQGCYAEAAQNIVLWLSQNRDDGKAMALLTRAYANQGKISEALQSCEKAIAVGKLNAGFHYLRATILQEQDVIDEAMKSLKRALYLDQNFVLAHFALGNLTRQRGKFKESKKHFENALSLLRAYRQEDTLPESEGMTAGRLMEIIRSMTYRERSV